MNEYNWAVEDIYGSVDEWEKEYNRVLESLDFQSFKGKLGDVDGFYSCMKEQERLGRVIEKLSVYAMMKHDEDTKNALYDALSSKVMALGAKYGEATAFVVPELTAMPEEKLKEYISNPKLSDYDYFLKIVLKEKAHVLSESEEKILALSSESLSSFKEIFTKIDNADLPLTEISYKGEKIPLRHGTFSVILHGEDRNLRKKAFKEYYKAYISLINTISSTYYGSVKKDVFFSKVSKYNSSLERALLGEDVSSKVYDNLIQSVHKALPLLHSYMRERKKLLGLKKMYPYDLYVPLVKDAEMKLDFESAYQLVIEGLKPLGEEYASLLKRAKDERWIDVYEREGKRSGAYSVAVYDTHPYVLLNYQKTTHDVFTIAHEMGHSIHSYFSNRTQCYAKADYKIFVAEVASTVNEVLLIRHFINTSKDNKLKKYLLSYLLEMIRTTLFRQTQFAEFEYFSHKTVEDGQPLTKENMSEEYLRLTVKLDTNGLEYRIFIERSTYISTLRE